MKLVLFFWLAGVACVAGAPSADADAFPDADADADAQFRYYPSGPERFSYPYGSNYGGYPGGYPNIYQQPASLPAAAANNKVYENAGNRGGPDVSVAEVDPAVEEVPVAEVDPLPYPQPSPYGQAAPRQYGGYNFGQRGGPGLYNNRFFGQPKPYNNNYNNNRMGNKVYSGSFDPGSYGSAAIPVTGNVTPLQENTQQVVGVMDYNGQQTVGYQPDYNGQQTVGYQPFPQEGVNYPAYSQPAPPVFQARPPVNNFMPPMNLPAPVFNDRNQMFTRSYTPIQNTPCMNVCRSRPVMNAKPVCQSACNVKPACSVLQPKIDYQFNGNTLNCRPRPVYNQGGGCGQSSCGTRPNYNQGYNPYIQAKAPGYPAAANTLPATVQFDRNGGRAPTDICVGSGCNNQGPNIQAGTGAATLPAALPEQEESPEVAVDPNTGR